MTKRALVGALLLLVAARVSAQGVQYQTVDFYELQDFTYNLNEPFETEPHRVVPSRVPPDVRQLDGQKIAIEGLVVLLTTDKSGSSEFMLTVSADYCGYGLPPRLNEFMYVKLTGGRKVPLVHGKQYQVKGVFHLKEELEDGRVTRLYSMDADSVQ